MLSFDYKSMDQAEKLSTFFDFISNPQKFADIIASIKKSTQEAKQVIEAYTSVTQANIYLEEAKQVKESAEEKAKETLDSAVKQSQETLDSVKVEQDKLESASKAFALKVQEQNDREKVLNALNDTLEVTKKETDIILSRALAKEADVNQRAEILFQKEQALKDVFKKG